MMDHPVTVAELVAILQTMPQDMEVQMSMNMEYQSRVRSDMVEVFTREDGSQYVLITDCPGSLWDEDGYDDSMDGDHDSAMASAGFGTDEDYGYASDDY